MKTIYLTVLSGMLLFGVGCATSHEHHHAKMMGCMKCDCKMMHADAGNMEKCAMCGHMGSDHTKATDEKSEGSEHKH